MAQTKPPRILVVEDDMAIQGFCQTVLESGGYQVTAVSTAADGLAAFQKEKPDLVILDVGLPDGNGLDLAKKMGLGAESRVPHVFLTARQDLNTRLEAFQNGAHDYIQKPFAVEELLARVKVHLKSKSSLEDMAAKNYELELRDRARQDLTDMLVHDLKAPLTSIQGTIELIKARGIISSEAHKSLLEYAGTAADFMLLMLNDILDVGQAKTVGLKATRARTEVMPLFDKLVALFAGRTAKSGVSLEPVVEPAAATLDLDFNLVFRILANLIQNAIKASDKGSKVELTALRYNGCVRFVVADRGPGVPDDQKEKIFEKYTTSGRQGGITLVAGSGVGLTFCRVAAAAQQGKVWVEDRPGGGSLFILEVPCPKS
jgi:two-component system, sensor histidine kinase and response regulator